MKDIKDIIIAKLRTGLITEDEMGNNPHKPWKGNVSTPAPQASKPNGPPMKEAKPKSDSEPKKEKPTPTDKDTGVALKSDGEEKGGKALYASVKSVLGNPMINHAEVIRQLWADSDNASARSLFRKKLAQEKMTNGEGHYEFTLDELIKIKNIVNKAGKAMVVSQ